MYSLMWQVQVILQSQTQGGADPAVASWVTLSVAGSPVPLFSSSFTQSLPEPLVVFQGSLSAPPAVSVPQPRWDQWCWGSTDLNSLASRALILHLLNEPLSSGLLMLYLAVEFDSSHLCEGPASSGKDETQIFRAAFPDPFSYWSSQSLGELSDFSTLQLWRKQLWAMSHLSIVLQLQLSEHPHLSLCYKPITSGLRSKVPVTWKWGKEGHVLHKSEGGG